MHDHLKIGTTLATDDDKWYITVDGGKTGFYWSFKRTRMCYVTRDRKVYAVSLPEFVSPNIT